MRRHGLLDERWEWIEGPLPGRVEHVGVTAADNQVFVEEVLYRPCRCGAAAARTCTAATAAGPQRACRSDCSGTWPPTPKAR